MNCNICNQKSQLLDTATILRKYKIEYYSCTNCGFIQTENPYWLEEAYSSAIARSDIGLIRRNIKLSKMCSVLLPFLSKEGMKFLDYGAGNGMFVRLMRDIGFDFYWKDKFSPNQFSSGFEGLENQKYAAVTSFEVFEHLVNPLTEIQEMLKCSNTLIFTTRILPYQNVNPRDWWYFTLDTGQHISLYTLNSLKYIANNFGLKLSSNGVSFHIISSHRISDVILKFISYSPFATVLSKVVNFRRKSFLDSDYHKITEHHLGR